ncbi:MAG: hypothetical protein ACJATI_005616 [Halioglobus sp.]|jgi:hypothetical protein
MRLITKCIIATLTLCTISINAQTTKIEGNSILVVNELSSYHNDVEYNPLTFNYHEYEEVNLEDFGKSFQIDDVKKYTFFAIFSHSGTKELFQVHSDNKVVKISDDLVEGKQDMTIEVDEDFSNMLLYSGSNGQETKNEMSSGLRIGRDDHERGRGIINLAEVLVYDKILTKDEIKKKQSHLSIKYGISLPMDTSYVDEDGYVLFNPNLHDGYTNRVIALANDENLNVSQTTHHRDQFLEIGLSKINQVQKENMFSLRTGSYIFIADNGGSIQFENSRLGRVWEFSSSNLTNNTKSFCFKFSIKDIEEFGTSFDYFLSFSENENFDDKQSIKLNLIGEVSLLDAERQYISITRRPKKSQNEDIVTLNINNLQIEGRKIEAQLSSILKDLQGHLCLYNVEGYIIDRTEVNTANDFRKTYSFTHPGIYFLSYISGETQTVKKVVIQ